MKALENIKKNYKTDVPNAGMVVLGLIVGKAAGAVVDKIVEKYPDTASWAQYVKPLVIAGSGIIVASAAEKDSKYKYLGYGIAGAGVLSGIKLIPYVGDILGSIDEAPKAYYTENGFQKLELGNFGLNALPISSMNIQEANSFTPELPELEGVLRGSNTEEENDTTTNNNYNLPESGEYDLNGML